MRSGSSRYRRERQKGYDEMKNKKNIYYYKIEGAFVYLKPDPDFYSEDTFFDGADGKWAIWLRDERILVIPDIDFEYRNNPALMEAQLSELYQAQVVPNPTLIIPAQTPEFFERIERIKANPQPTENREKPKKTVKDVLIRIFVAIVIAAVVIKIAIAILGW
jgi:hypothetical protein